MENKKLTEFEVATLQQRGPIAAIQEFRQRTGLGLLEAKNAVDEVAKRLGFMKKEECIYCGGRGYNLHYDWSIWKKA